MAKKTAPATTKQSPIVKAGSKPKPAAVDDRPMVSDRPGGVMRPATDEEARMIRRDGQRPAVELSDTLARERARDPAVTGGRTARDIVNIPVNERVMQLRADLVLAVAAKGVTNWEVAMIETMADMRELQDGIDAYTARIDELREQLKQGLAHSDDTKTFKCKLGSANMAAGAQRVSIVDPKLVPSNFLKTEIDTAKVGKVLRADVEVPGATLVTGAPTLRVQWEE